MKIYYTKQKLKADYFSINLVHIFVCSWCFGVDHVHRNKYSIFRSTSFNTNLALNNFFFKGANEHSNRCGFSAPPIFVKKKKWNSHYSPLLLRSSKYVSKIRNNLHYFPVLKSLKEGKKIKQFYLQFSLS